MKIKRYVAASMRVALGQVRSEQGAEAVILSSRRVEEGIEVIAAVDYDEALFVDAIRPTRASLASASEAVPTAGQGSALAQGASSPQSGREVAAPERRAAARTATVPAQIAAPARAAVAPPVPARAPANAECSPTGAEIAGSGLLVMQRELRGLRELLESELAHMTWHDTRLREPLKARVIEELCAMDIAPDVAAALASRTPRNTNLKDPSHIPLALLVKHLPVVDHLHTGLRGVIAIVGPTGAGKTTTIAKLAARGIMQHGSGEVALVSTDNYRIGAREQLMTYAGILDAPMYTANGGRELGCVLDRLKSKRLILIDTAGMGPRDVRLSEQLAALKLGAARARVLIALPAQGEGQTLDAIVRAFASVAPSACIVTKVDEAASLGGVISTTLRHNLKIAYLCDGQRVPENLHAAHRRRVWLIRAAHKLKERAPPRGEHYYARNFGKAPAHA